LEPELQEDAVAKKQELNMNSACEVFQNYFLTWQMRLFFNAAKGLLSKGIHLKIDPYVPGSPLAARGVADQCTDRVECIGYCPNSNDPHAYDEANEQQGVEEAQAREAKLQEQQSLHAGGAL
jgi:hypothetical protein